MIYTGKTSIIDYGQVSFDLPDGKTYNDCWIISFEALNLNSEYNEYLDWACAYPASGIYTKLSTKRVIVYTSGSSLEQCRDVPFRLVIGYK